MKMLALSLFILSLGTVTGSANAGEQTATDPREVILTFDDDDIEYCQPAGDVKAKSGWGGSAGGARGRESVKATLRKRAAALGANVVRIQGMSFDFMTAGKGVAYRCSADAVAQQRAKATEIARKSAAEVTCQTGIDCEVRWSRVTKWLQQHSEWKFRNVTDTLITTEGPMETTKPAFEVTKMPVGDGKTYRISMRAFCGSGDCTKRILKLRASFYDEITAPIVR